MRFGFGFTRILLFVWIKCLAYISIPERVDNATHMHIIHLFSRALVVYFLFHC